MEKCVDGGPRTTLMFVKVRSAGSWQNSRLDNAVGPEPTVHILTSRMSRTTSVFDTQLASDTSHKLGDTALEGQRATQKEQASRLCRLNVGAKRPWGMRQVDAKVSQTFFSGSVRCVGGHDQLCQK